MKKALGIFIKIAECIGVAYLWLTVAILILLALFGGSFSLQLNIFK